MNIDHNRNSWLKVFDPAFVARTSMRRVDSVGHCSLILISEQGIVFNEYHGIMVHEQFYHPPHGTFFHIFFRSKKFREQFLEKKPQTFEKKSRPTEKSVIRQPLSNLRCLLRIVGFKVPAVPKKVLSRKCCDVPGGRKKKQRQKSNPYNPCTMGIPRFLPSFGGL